MFSIAAIIAIEEENRRKKEIKVQRKMLRDASNPLELSEFLFKKNFRLTKSAFLYILREIESNLKHSGGCSISPLLKLAATIRFLAEGSYQQSICNDFQLGMAQSTFSKILTEVLNILENKFCPIWIKLEMTEREKQKNKLMFFERTGFPGIIGCIDGTHVRIIKPNKDVHLFYNRKGFYSLNVMLICDAEMRIRYVDSTHQGACHDSLVWNVSEARKYFQHLYLQGERGNWLSGDAGYPLEPFLMTPFRSPAEGSRESKFNKIHRKARNIIERTIGVLKNRFRCLLDARQLHYTPTKASQIINVCCALQNICVNYNVDYDNLLLDETNDSPENVTDIYEEASVNQVANQIRNEIMNSFY